MKRPSSAVNRRDLLRLRASQPAVAPPAQPERLNGGDLLRASRPGMGSYFEVRLPAHAPGCAALAGAMLDLMDRLERQLTIYRDDSEVSQINRSSHPGPVSLEPGLYRLLAAAVELSRATGGAYDVASGALSHAWGFVKGPKRVPAPDELADARARSGSYHLRLDPEGFLLSADRPGVLLDFGSIGKGYALDRMATLMREHWWPMSGLLHAGRSSLLAVGSPPDDFGGRWKIAVRNPLQPERLIGVLHLRNRALGTSGLAYQSFVFQGRRYGHILDPRTGYPCEEGPVSVTVLAPTAAEADALSTAFFLMGPDATAAFLKDRPDVGVLFLFDQHPNDQTDGGEGFPPVHTINLTRDDWTPEPLPARATIG